MTNWRTGPRRHKYGAKATVVDGYRFDSKGEARRYTELTTLRTAGEVAFILRQVPFHLPGGVKLVLDFVIFWTNGLVTFEDFKGVQTESFKAKRKMVETLYPIDIEIVK